MKGCKIIGSLDARVFSYGEGPLQPESFYVSARLEGALAGHQVNQPLLSFALLAGKINILL